MTNATFNLENLGLTITFPRSIIRGRFSSLETYAIWQAQSFLKHGRCEDGCVAVLNVAEGMTAGDIKAARQQKRQADGQRRVEEVAPNANEPAIASDGKPAPASAPVESEWPKWFLNGSAGICEPRVPWEAVRHDERGDGGHWFNQDGSSGFAALYRDNDPNYREITPTEAAKWLRANGHAAEAERIERASDPLAGAEVERCREGHVKVIASDSVYLCIHGRWTRLLSGGAFAYKYEKVPAQQAQEAIESLRRWMEKGK